MSTPSLDIHGGLFGSVPYSLIMVVSYILVQSFGNFLLLALITAIRDNHSRTLVQEILSKICHVQLAFNVVPLNVNLARFLFGPLPGIFCDIQGLTKTIHALTSLLLAHHNFIARLLYALVWRNVGRTNDSFISMWINVWCSFTALKITLYCVYLNDHHGFHYRVCLGITSEELEEGDKPVFGMIKTIVAMFVVYMLLFNICSGVYLFRFGQSKAFGRPLYFLKPTYFVTTVAIFSFFPEIVFMAVPRTQNLDIFGNQVLYLLCYILPPLVISIVMPATYVVLHTNLRQGIMGYLDLKVRNAYHTYRTFTSRF